MVLSRIPRQLGCSKCKAWNGWRAQDISTTAQCRAHILCPGRPQSEDLAQSARLLSLRGMLSQRARAQAREGGISEHSRTRISLHHQMSSAPSLPHTKGPDTIHQIIKQEDDLSQKLDEKHDQGPLVCRWTSTPLSCRVLTKS